MANNKVKLFVVSDIHGFNTILQETLNQKGFDINNPNHYLLVCGDLFDRGPEAKEVYEFVKSLNNRFIYIRGNHEDLLFKCVDLMQRGLYVDDYHYHNRTVDTVCQFCNITERSYDELQSKSREIIFDDEHKYQGSKYHSENFNFIKFDMRPILDFINDKSVDFLELKDYIFVHGWIPCNEDPNWGDLSKFKSKDWRKADKGYWEAARWRNGMNAWKQGITEPNKTIVCGHFHFSWGWSHLDQTRKEYPNKSRVDWEKSFEPYVNKGIIAIDACTAYSNIMNCLIIDVTKEELDEALCKSLEYKFSNLINGGM